jgi:hypothetical protein
MNRRSFLTYGFGAGAATLLLPQAVEPCCCRRCRPMCPTQVCVRAEPSIGATYAAPTWVSEWKFLVPANHLAIFYFVSNSGSKRYNLFQLIGPGSAASSVPIVPSHPAMHRIPRQNVSIEYTLMAWAQVPATSNVTRSQINPREVQLNKEWILTVRGQEGKDLVVNLLITP